MDAFYAAVEQRDNPELRGKPVLVGGRGRRGVVTTASYEARAFGCRAAMPTGQALRLCPHAIVVGIRMSVYAEVSRQVREILLRFTPDVQPISIDEAFMDVTLVRHLHGEPMAIGRAVKDAIRSELKLTASVGVSCNKFLAKVASDMGKPDGLAEIPEGRAAEMLATMPVSVIFGIGPAAAERLAKLGVKTITDLRNLGEVDLARRFGPPTAALWMRLAHGLDDRPVSTGGLAKSIGKERTFGEDIASPAKLRALLLSFVEDVTRDLREEGVVCRRVTIKLRTGDFSTFTRSATLREPTDETDAIWAATEPMLAAWFKERRPALRLIGVSLSELTTERQLGLFESAPSVRAAIPIIALANSGDAAGSATIAPKPPRREKLDSAVDAVVKKFGKGAIRRGGGMEGA